LGLFFFSLVNQPVGGSSKGIPMGKSVHQLKEAPNSKELGLFFFHQSISRSAVLPMESRWENPLTSSKTKLFITHYFAVAASFSLLKYDKFAT
jgi:hypothetical protein